MAPVWKATFLEALAGQKTTAGAPDSMSAQVLQEVLAGGSSDNSVRLWDLEQQIELALLEGAPVGRHPCRDFARHSLRRVRLRRFRDLFVGSATAVPARSPPRL